jgi:hypothetical protein
MKTITVSDRIGLTSRQVTDEGYLIAPGTLARTGVQNYFAYEMGLVDDGLDPMKIISLHRPPEEVFAPDSMASFEGKPITLNHPPEGSAVTADNWAELAKGDVRDISRAGDLMTATLVIRSKDAIEAIQTGKSELSNGYTRSQSKPTFGWIDTVCKNIRADAEQELVRCPGFRGRFARGDHRFDGDGQVSDTQARKHGEPSRCACEPGDTTGEAAGKRRAESIPVTHCSVPTR